MSTDFIGARAQKKWRAPFSDEGFVDVTQDDYEKEKEQEKDPRRFSVRGPSWPACPRRAWEMGWRGAIWDMLGGRASSAPAVTAGTHSRWRFGLVFGGGYEHEAPASAFDAAGGRDRAQRR